MGGDGVPYPLQTGLTKYAPMQPIPPTKITKKQYSPLYPTSAVTIATTWLPNPTIVTTVTASLTFSVSSMENTAAPASNPNPDMAKFLNRWKDWILHYLRDLLHTNYCVHGGVSMVFGV